MKYRNIFHIISTYRYIITLFSDLCNKIFSFIFPIEGNNEKNLIQIVRALGGGWTRDLPNVGQVHYHGANLSVFSLD